MKTFLYIVQRRTKTGFEYYTGGGFWSANERAAEKYDGDRATVLCINMGNRGMDASFRLAPE